MDYMVGFFGRHSDRATQLLTPFTIVRRGASGLQTHLGLHILMHGRGLGLSQVSTHGEPQNFQTWSGGHFAAKTKNFQDVSNYNV